MSRFILGFVAIIIVGRIFKPIHGRIKQCILRLRWKMSKNRRIQKTSEFDTSLIENSIKIVERNYLH
jgi:hypothetical protein